LGYDLHSDTPDHSSLSRIRWRLDSDTHASVFKMILLALQQAGLIQGKTIGVDATTLEANAAMRSIVRRDTGQSYRITWSNWPGMRGSRIPHGRIWPSWTSTAKAKGRMNSGNIRMIRMRGSPR